MGMEAAWHVRRSGKFRRCRVASRSLLFMIMQSASRSVTGKATTVVTRKRIATTPVLARDTKRRRVEVKSTTTVNTFINDVNTSEWTQALESLEQDTLGESWRKALQIEFSKPYFRKLKDFLISEHKSHPVYPPIRDIYSWSRLTPLESVKAVVLGQVRDKILV